MNQPLDDLGAPALAIIARWHRLASDPDAIRRTWAQADGSFDDIHLLRAAKDLGLKGRSRPFRADRAARLPLPALIHCGDGRWRVLAKVEDGRALVQAPGQPPEIVAVADLPAGAPVLLFTVRSGVAAAALRFSLGWFIPAFLKYRATLFQVLIASFFLQIFGLITPLLFQVVMDKVLPHHGYSTLTVVGIAMLGVVLFENALGFLRSWLLTHTTSRIDVELGARLYTHLLALPLAYFQSRPTGQTVARVRELESIREFLTGAALTVALDVAFSVVFLAVLWMYSPSLTWIVLFSLPVYVLISFLIGPPLRRMVEELFQRGAANQSLLVETVAGAETVKAMAVEPQMRSAWETNLAGYVRQGFRTALLAAAGGRLIEIVGRVVMVLIIWIGSDLVIKGSLTIGELIAFHMIAQQVSTPILRLAQLWQQWQQTRISIDRLGDILNTPAEPGRDRASPALPALRGAIAMERVGFRYQPDGSDVIDGLDLRIEPGTVVGVVGRSGSGKSTLSRLIQRLYVPQRGRVLIDGYDLAMADPSWLRRQIGVVLQDNVLFNRSVRDNIALADPAMAMEKVIDAARLAGAHEFILELPHGYETVLEERGSNLSGGQRQRIAIARALASDPRILILDEATSALDYESERRLQENFARIRAGRTVLIIAHRLSTVLGSDRILVIERGRVVEDGPPRELMARDGHFSRLLNQHEGRP